MTEEEEQQDNDWTACGILTGVLVIALGAIVFAGIRLKPSIDEWIAGIGKDEKNPAGIDWIEEGTRCPLEQEICPAFAEQAVAEALAAVPACEAQVCVPWQPSAELPPDAVPQYLLFANELIDDMEAAAGIHEAMQLIMAQEGNESAMIAVMKTDEWRTLQEDFEFRVGRIRRSLWEHWPPGPATADNPLMDAHARLMMAYTYLDDARDEMWNTERSGRSRYFVFDSPKSLEGMREQIDLARVWGLRYAP